MPNTNTHIPKMQIQDFIEGAIFAVLDNDSITFARDLQTHPQPCSLDPVLYI